MGKFESLVRGAERSADMVVILFMFLIMAVVTIDVAMRYVLNMPLDWSHDFISLYAMAAIFFFALPASYRSRSHIGVDIFLEYLPPRFRTYSDILADVVGLCIFVPIVVVGYQRTRVSFTNSEVLAGLIPWPTWIYNAMVPLGAGLLCIRLAFNLLRSASGSGADVARNGASGDAE